MKVAFATVIVLTALVSLSVGAAFIFSDNGGGFFPGLGVALGLICLAAGNVLVLALNLVFRAIYGAPRWLRAVILIQVIPAAISLTDLASFLYGNWQDNHALQQGLALRRAIKADDPERLEQAQKQCGKRCAARFSLNKQLLDAADAGAGRVASVLIRQHAVVSSGLGQPGYTLGTCEGDPLIELDALGVAVARHDTAMVDRLFPVSDKGARRAAMWLAAELDRLDLVQRLAAKGVPLTIRGKILDENDTLLVAAASGAALKVGRWLIDTHHMPVNAIWNGPDPYSGTAPLQALLRFESWVPDSPRIKPFLHLLAAHGARLDVRDDSGRTPLQEAIRTEDKRVAELLLGAGADKALLPVGDRESLTALLAEPDAPDYPGRPRPDCVPP